MMEGFVKRLMSRELPRNQREAGRFPTAFSSFISCITYNTHARTALLLK